MQVVTCRCSVYNFARIYVVHLACRFSPRMIFLEAQTLLAFNYNNICHILISLDSLCNGLMVSVRMW